MLPRLQAGIELRDSLVRRNIRFAHWKSNSHLAEALAGRTDLDLFVDAQSREDFNAVMAEMACLPMRSPPWARYPGVEDWLVFDGATGSCLHLHVHYRLVTGLKHVKHLVLPWDNALFANLRNDGASGWPIPTAEMELLTLLVRIWAKMPPWRMAFRPSVPGRIVDEFGWLQRDVSPDRLVALARDLDLVVDATALAKLATPPVSVPAILSMSRHLYRQMRSCHRMSWSAALASTGLRKAHMLFNHAWRKRSGGGRSGKTLRDRGAMIALVGSDGAGKSTLSGDLERWLRFKLDAHLLYLGSGDGASGTVNAMRRKLSALWRRQGGKRVPGVAKEGRGEMPSTTKLYRLLHLQLMYRKLRLLRRGRRLAERGAIILLDRYPQSQVNSLGDGPRLQEGGGFAWAAAIERELYAEAGRLGPDLLIKLQVTPEVAHRRKPDHDRATIARKCAIVDALEFPRSNVAVIDADRSYADVLLAAKHEVWRFLTGRAS